MAELQHLCLELDVFINLEGDVLLAQLAAKRKKRVAKGSIHK